MARLRFWTVALLALALAGNSTQTARTAGQAPTLSYGWSNAPTDKTDERTCVIYALGDMGYNADLGKWIAESLPELIAPGSWKESGVLRYYAPKNILIVNHSAKVHKQVDVFLKNMKPSLPKGGESHGAARRSSPRDVVVPAAYRGSTAFQTSGIPEPSSYPVPAPVKAPKHLFHFLIRYEGEGIIDDNVVKFMKVQNQGAKSEKEATVPAAASYSSATMGLAPAVGSPAMPVTSPDSSGSTLPVTNVYPSASPKVTEEKPTKKKENADKR